MASENSSIDLILVPQGAEQRAVLKGAGAVNDWGKSVPHPIVLPIPMGPQTVYHHLEVLQSNGQLPVSEGCNVLLMGLGGSLSSSYHIGDVILTSQMSLISDHGVVSSTSAHLPLVRTLYSALTRELGEQCTCCVGVEKGVTCDRIIFDPTEKHTLNQVYGANVVDMEGSLSSVFFNL
ncbi:MAG: hypothetical protein F6K09_25350 [Merismopedia sp. SIO2A8]|nr:hypothetical protein [Merismopedia sp. SIO2A8]